MKTWNWMEQDGYEGEALSVTEAMEAQEREELEARWAYGYPDACELAEAMDGAAQRFLETGDPADWDLYSDLYKDLNGSRPYYDLQDLRRVYGRA